MTTGYDREHAVPVIRWRWVAIGILAAVLATVAAVAWADQAIDATVCRAANPTRCVCVSLIVEGADAGGQAQLAAWIAHNPGWVIAALGVCTQRVET